MTDYSLNGPHYNPDAPPVYYSAKTMEEAPLMSRSYPRDDLYHKVGESPYDYLHLPRTSCEGVCPNCSHRGMTDVRTSGTDQCCRCLTAFLKILIMLLFLVFFVLIIALIVAACKGDSDGGDVGGSNDCNSCCLFCMWANPPSGHNGRNDANCHDCFFCCDETDAKRVHTCQKCKGVVGYSQ